MQVQNHSTSLGKSCLPYDQLIREDSFGEFCSFLTQLDGKVNLSSSKIFLVFSSQNSEDKKLGEVNYHVLQQEEDYCAASQLETCKASVQDFLSKARDMIVKKQSFEKKGTGSDPLSEEEKIILTHPSEDLLRLMPPAKIEAIVSRIQEDLNACLSLQNRQLSSRVHEFIEGAFEDLFLDLSCDCVNLSFFKLELTYDYHNNGFKELCFLEIGSQEVS